MGTSAIGTNSIAQDRKVAGSSGDSNPDFLDGKVDNSTIVVTADKLVRSALTGDVTTVGNAATVVGGNADTVTTNANLTGDVTSVGNAATVVTNADLTGDVTSVGNAATIPSDTITTAMRADGTDGEIPTWNSSGVASNVSVGTSGDVLTSGGTGVAPTFQTPAGGGGLSNVIFQWTGVTDFDTGVGLVHDTILNTATATTNVYMRNQANGQIRTMFRTKFLKAAGVDNLLLYARLAGNGVSNASCQLNVGSASGETPIVTGNTPTWRNVTIDINALSDGTVFDLEIRLRNSLNNQVWLYSVIVFGAE